MITERALWFCQYTWQRIKPSSSIFQKKWYEKAMSQRTLKKKFKIFNFEMFCSHFTSDPNAEGSILLSVGSKREEKTNKNTKHKDDSGQSLTVCKNTIKAKWMYFYSGTRKSTFKSQGSKDSVEPSTSQHCRPKLHVHLKKKKKKKEIVKMF